MLITTQVATAPCTDPIKPRSLPLPVLTRSLPRSLPLPVLTRSLPRSLPLPVLTRSLPRSLPLPVLTRSKPTCVQKSPANSYLHEVRLNLIEPHVSDAVFLPVFVIEVPPFGFEDGEAFRFHFPAQ